MNIQSHQPTNSNLITNVLSFATILNDRQNFRKSGTRSGSDFNYLDTPGQKFFKLFFYFHNNDNENIAPVGLLSPTWMLNLKEDEWYLYQSAWTYLKMNCEDERADKLKLFVTLLSNINSQSPWYFSELTGLDSAINRKLVNEENVSIGNERQKISIKCLQDAFDDRIGTLLDLYRSVTWSWIQKKEILPANLRKFDMGILVFDTPTAPFHTMYDQYKYLYNQDQYISSLADFRENEFADIGPDTNSYNQNSNYKTSYKYYELHNCEIEYNSPAAAMGALNNKEGIQPEYTIDVYFDDCFETRYNESLLEDIGDLLFTDLYYQSENMDPDTIYNKSIERLENNIKSMNPRLQERLEFYGDNNQLLIDKSNKLNSNIFEERISTPSDNGFFGKAINQIKTVTTNALQSLQDKVFLGNLYTFPLSALSGQIKDVISSGNILNGVRIGKKMLDNTSMIVDNNLSINLLGRPTKKILPTVKQIGNLFSADTIAKNT